MLFLLYFSAFCIVVVTKKYDMDHCVPYIEGDRCFKWFRKILNWNDAESFCQSLGQGVHLASTRDAAENGFIRNNVLPYYESFDVMRFGPWLGAKNNGTGGFYEWTDGSDWVYWNFKDKRDMTITGQCIRLNLNDDLYIDKRPNGTWHVSMCDDEEYNSVLCGKPLEDRDTTTTTTTLAPGQTTLATIATPTVNTTVSEPNETLTVALISGSIVLFILITLLVITIIICYKRGFRGKSHVFNEEQPPPPAVPVTPIPESPVSEAKNKTSQKLNFQLPIIGQTIEKGHPPKNVLPTIRAYDVEKPQPRIP